MKQFICIGGKSISVATLARMLGVQEENPSVELHQETPVGDLVATCEGEGTGHHLGYMEVNLHLPRDKKTTPILLSYTEAQVNNDGESENLLTFLYSRDNEYIAFHRADLRSDEEVNADGVQDREVVLSGIGPDAKVTAYCDNPHVAFSHSASLSVPRLPVFPL